MPKKKYYGIYQGIVTNTKDPEKRGRIKILCPEVLDDKVESAWCDPCVPIAYDNGGDFCIPQVDEAVWVMFIGGDSNSPVYMGGWWRKDKTPFGTEYDKGRDTTRIISYADCTITMIDGKISINVGEKDSFIDIEDEKIHIKNGNDFYVDIKDKKVYIKGDVDIEGNLKVHEKLDVEIGLTVKNDIEVVNVNASGTVRANELISNTTVTGTNIPKDLPKD